MKVQQVKAVIGSNFGDEGKGLLTDYFVTKAQGEGLSPVVIRFNGGAQAGHTVELSDGSRFVYGHLGAGTFRGAPTFLSRFFLSNPLLFLDEFEGYVEENAGKPRPVVYVDPLGLVTTPFDMLLNQLAEEERGDSRHGSCGRGINETIRRSEDYGGKYRITVADLLDRSGLEKKLELIQTEYVPLRITALGIRGDNEVEFSILQGGGIVSRFPVDVREFLDKVTIVGPEILGVYDSLVFEGAQGLLLDRDNVKYFPHLTNSNTGVKNVATMIVELDIDPSLVEVIYVTRWFITRHGAGPFHQESKDFHYYYPHIKDRTNEFNEYQGSLRYGFLDLDTWGKEVQADFLFALKGMRKSVAVTWMDQIDGKDVPATTHSYYNGMNAGQSNARLYWNKPCAEGKVVCYHPAFHVLKVISNEINDGPAFLRGYQCNSRYSRDIEVVIERPAYES